MQITTEEARRAGVISRQFAWTDEELALVISTTELTVAFLEGRGSEWHLALSPLRQELSQLKSFAAARQKKLTMEIQNECVSACEKSSSREA